MSGRLIEIPYKPRDAFKAYHASSKRFGVSVCHRRAGKTVARINRLIRSASCIRRDYPPGRFGYLAPYRKQAKEIAWLYLKHYAAPLISLGGKLPNETELSITMPHNGASVTLYGAENAEAMRGLYFDGVVMDEAQGISKHVLTQIVLPCLADYQGWLDVSGTPRGWSNTLGEIVKMARLDEENWFLQELKASASNILSPDELRRQRQLMSENEYDQEYECSFDAAITGAIYGRQLKSADDQGRITAVKPAHGIPVHTAWDLGWKDATAIWWFQRLRNELRILDYYENNFEEIDHYCSVLHSRAKDGGYTYGTHYVPQDAGNELQAAGGRSIVQLAWTSGGIRMSPVAFTSQQNGIEAGRFSLRSCWFDREKCDDVKYPAYNGQSGLDVLRNYQFEYDAEKKVYRDKPRHDWASHGSKAFEILARAWREPLVEAEKPAPRFLDQVRAEELFDLKGEFNRISSHRERRI